MNTEQNIIYPIEPWTVTETEFNTANNYRNETTFALSNGYIGTRGTFEEGYDFSIEEGLEGNFINGFYESEHIRYGEWNYGFPEKSQSLLNVCNAKIMRIYLDDEMLDMRRGKIKEYTRRLHMKEGIVTRELVWVSPQEKMLSLRTERLVSFDEKNILAERMTLCLLADENKERNPADSNNKKVSIRIESELNGDVENHTRKTNPLVDYGPFGRRLVKEKLTPCEKGSYYEGTTQNSKLSMGCRVLHAWNRNPDKIENHAKELKVINVYEWSTGEGESIVIDKWIAYTTSIDMPKNQMESYLEETGYRVFQLGYEGLKQKQLSYMEHFWKNADVMIKGNDALLQGLRFNLFHIMQSAGRDGKTGMGAKGLSGEGYEGHYFWDTEMYILPVFIYTCPELAKSLLNYRYHTLEEARQRARVLGHEKGALYPWRTINGQEASTYFPLGTAQYHINGDIAYAFWLYMTVTEDYKYLEEATEVLCETARVYADVGCFAESREGRYCICAVTGPDEYNAIVDNNFYTNLMARENLRYAQKALIMLKNFDSVGFVRLTERLGITQEEVREWQKIVDRMYFPYDEARGVYPLDDGFMMRKPWDDSKIPVEKRHLLYENYHPLFIYRQRMSKQADAVLGMYLHSNFFSKEELKQNYDFYQEVTLHHSSLSTCIFGIVACETGDYEDACRYFSQSARMDLDDYHKNFYAGIHAANMAGTWLSVINGFAGLRTNADKLEFSPYLPDDMESYEFTIGYKGRKVQVVIRKQEAEFTLLKGRELVFYVKEKEVRICKEGGTAIEQI